MKPRKVEAALKIHETLEDLSDFGSDHDARREHGRTVTVKIIDWLMSSGNSI